MEPMAGVYINIFKRNWIKKAFVSNQQFEEEIMYFFLENCFMSSGGDRPGKTGPKREESS